MRIDVNLKPGAKRGKKKKSGGSINFAALGASIAAKFKDVWLASAIASGAVAVAAIGLLFMMQRTKAASIDAALVKAVEDSTRYATVLSERARLEARRDSAITQLNIIRAIDEERYIWPHILDEASRALPPYTWIRSLALSGQAQGSNPAAAYRQPPPDTTKKGKRKSAPFVFPKDTVKFRIVGRTADYQAFTRYYQTLEDSPFFGGVTFSKTETQTEQNKPVIQFTIDVTYTRPDSSLLRRAAIVPPK